MTGISTVKSRRLPASLSNRPMGIADVRLQIADWRLAAGAGESPAVNLQPAICNLQSLVVARHRLDGGDDLLVGDVVGGADETGVAAVHEDGPVAVGVAPQRGDELTPLRVVQRTEIHTTFSLPEKRLSRNSPSAPCCQLCE